MTLHDALIFALFVVVSGILSGVLQAKFSAPDPNTKRIAHLERQVKELLARLGIEETQLTDVQVLIAQGRKINAIKLYREQTGIGLREAKEAVDAMADQMKAMGLV